MLLCSVHPQAGEHLNGKGRALCSQGPGEHPQIQHQMPAGPHRGGQGMNNHQQRKNRHELLCRCLHDGCNVPGLTMKVIVDLCVVPIEGEWQPVFAAIEACHQAVHAMGCPRVYTTVKINTRTDKEQTLEVKVASVQALL